VGDRPGPLLDQLLGATSGGRGVTKPVVLTLVFNGVNPGMGRGEVAGFEASVVLSRKDFGVGGELPLDGGGTIVGDKVTITLALEAVKQA
jgi:polyisoprenoid-binding protein YceI